MFRRYFSLLVISGLFFAQSIWNQTIVDSFPAPGWEPRGLAWDGAYLWSVDAADDSVYKMDPSSGAVISSFPFPIYSGYGGLTWSEDTTIWIANGDFIYQVNPTNGDEISSFPCPGG